MTIKTGVEFDGDASGAKKAGKDVETALSKVGKEAKDMAKSIVAGGLAFMGVAGGIDIARRALDMTSAAVGDYIARNEELAAIAAAGRAEVGGYVDALLAQQVTTESVTEVMGTMAEAARIVTETVRAVAGESGSLSTTLASGLVTALRAAGEAVLFVRQGMDVGRLALIGLEGAVTIAFEAIASFNALLTSGLAAALDLIVAGTEGVIRGLAPFAGFLNDDMGAALTRAANSLGTMRTGIQGVRDDSLEFALGAGQRTTQALAALGGEAEVVVDRMTDTMQVTEEFRRQTDELSTSIETGTIRQRTFAAATRETAGATRTVTNELAAQAQVRGQILQQLYDQTRAEEAQRSADLLEGDKARAAAANALLDLEREKISALAIAEQEALAARGDAYGQYADRAGTALAAVASGQATVAEAARGAIGEVLEALATEAFVRAGVAAATGNIGGAIALGAAGVAARAAALALGGGGSGGGAVAPGVSSGPTTNTVTNRSITIQAGMVSSDFVADVARMMGEADRRGLT
jgi:hypothetical protein